MEDRTLDHPLTLPLLLSLALPSILEGQPHIMGQPEPNWAPGLPHYTASSQPRGGEHPLQFMLLPMHP